MHSSLLLLSKQWTRSSAVEFKALGAALDMWALTKQEIHEVFQLQTYVPRHFLIWGSQFVT